MGKSGQSQQLEISNGTEIKITLKNLEEYDGPYHLLLELVKAAKIDIKDIFLTDVTDQFLRHMEKLDEIDMDQASEFITVTASLLEIKARSLLPRIAGDNSVDELKGEFIERMQEYYKAVQEASVDLKKQEIVGQFYKEPDSSTLRPNYVLKDMTLDGLLNAFSKLMNRLEKSPVANDTGRVIKKDRYTAKQQSLYIQNIIRTKQRVNFFDLFAENYERQEVIATFQALLELLKSQIICVQQDTPFSDILIVLKEGGLQIIDTQSLIYEEEENG